MESLLKTPALRPLPLREIQPQGWLRNQLRIQANGLSGHLDLFWPDIRDSAWFGGPADGWERVPYWLDGFIPLAWLLDDEALKDRASRDVDYILEHQQEDGWICPVNDNRAQYDVWALFLVLKVLVVYESATRDARIQGAVEKALRSLDRHIDTTTLFAWGQMRWFECLIPLFWLYERTGEAWLVRLASKLRCQGFDWVGFYDLWPYEQPDEKGRWGQMSHVVNNAMALKSGALLWRLTGKDEHLRTPQKMLNMLDRYHGMAAGVFTGDECLAGLNPTRGTELCAVVEMMYSLEQAIAVGGDAALADRLEKIAYNALPATFSPDMWTHQYDQQANQVQCSFQQNTVFGTNTGDAHLFGLEPHFGCCTANLSQGWPKFASSLVMRSDDGLTVAVWAPCAVRTNVGGVPVSLDVQTEYPFRDTACVHVYAEQPLEFALRLRIPAWAKGATVEVDGETLRPQPGEFLKLARCWQGHMEVVLRFPMAAQLMMRPNDLWAVQRGPLVYALAIEERWQRIHEDVPGREFPHCDYEVYPMSPWNYGLRLAREDAATLSFGERPMGELPFSPQGAPVWLEAPASRVDWDIVDGSAAPAPGLNWVAGETETVRLIPYGCTNLRVTELPLLAKG